MSSGQPGYESDPGELVQHVDPLQLLANRAALKKVKFGLKSLVEWET